MNKRNGMREVSDRADEGEDKELGRRTTFILPRDVELTGEIVQKFIKKHLENDVKQYDCLASYLDGAIPKMRRKAPNKLLVRHDYASYIATLNSAYLVGEPVQYHAKKDTVDISALDDVYRDQHISDLDMELAEDCSVYGRAYERIYSDEDANARSAKLDVRNVIVVRDDTPSQDIREAIVLYPKAGEMKQQSFSLEIVDKKGTIRAELEGASYSADTEHVEEHFFGDVPIIEYPNNGRIRGDFEPIITLIDALNILQSDRVIDREKLVDAILAFYGATLAPEDMEKLKRERKIGLPDGAKAEYLIKNIDEADADVLRETLEKSIHKFSMTPDMSDENFAGTATGVSLRYKLLPFDYHVRQKERYFERGLKKRFELYNAFLSTKHAMGAISSSDVEIMFSRSMPKNELEISEIIQKLIGQGIVDKVTLATMLPFVKDAEETVKRAEAEEDRDFKRSLGNYGTNQPEEPEDEELEDDAE